MIDLHCDRQLHPAVLNAAQHKQSLQYNVLPGTFFMTGMELNAIQGITIIPIALEAHVFGYVIKLKNFNLKFTLQVH